MTIQQLRYLVAISKHNSLSKAADELYITQSNISKAIKQLEAELGFNLLERQPRGVSFTQNGLEFLRDTYTLLDHFDSMNAHWIDKNRDTSSISVASQHYIFVLMALSFFVQNLNGKDFSVTLHEINTSRIVEEVTLRTCDIGFIYYYDITEAFIKKELDKYFLHFHPLCNVKPYAYISKFHPLADKTSISLQQLSEYPYVCYDLGAEPNDLAEEVHTPVHPNKVLRVTDRLSMLKLIRHTNSYTLGSGIFHEDYFDPEIITKPLLGNVEDMHIGWITPTGSALTPIVKNFIELCRVALNLCRFKNPSIKILIEPEDIPNSELTTEEKELKSGYGSV